MGLFPIAMNIIQFWLIDSIVKATSQDVESESASSPRHSAVREPLISADVSGDESGEDGCSVAHVYDVESPEILHSRDRSSEIKASNSDDEREAVSPKAIAKSTMDAGEAHEYPPSSLDSSSSDRSMRSRSVTSRRQKFEHTRLSSEHSDSAQLCAMQESGHEAPVPVRSSVLLSKRLLIDKQPPWMIGGQNYNDSALVEL